MTQPWYSFRSDTPGSGAYGGIEPLCPGCYAKPDTNIAVPSGVPITALIPGTITDVSQRGAGDGGLSVTEKLQNAINSAAQYMSFNFLGSSSVHTGENISAGQQIGLAGSPTGINFALGLGADPSWGTANFSKYQGAGSPLTNPQKLVLDPINKGQTLGGCNCPPLYAESGTGVCNSLIPGFPQVPCGQAQGPIQQAGAGAVQQVQIAGLGNVGSQVGSILTNLTTPDFWMRIGIGVGAVVLVVLALLYFIKDTAPAQAAEKTAVVAAAA